MVQLHHQPATTLPKLVRASPLFHPRPQRREQHDGGSAYLFAAPVGQPAGIAPSLTLSTA